MNIIIAILVFTQIIMKTSAMDITCTADENKMSITVNNLIKAEVNSLNLYVRTLNKGSPWLQQPNCTLKNFNILQCSSKMKNNAQYLQVVVNKVNGKNESKRMWYYDCYPNHGPTDLKTVRNTVDGFSIKWSHYSWDEKFILVDKISITELKNNNTISLVTYKKKGANFTKVSAGSRYRVCIETTFPKPIHFLNLTSPFVKSCINVMTPTEEEDNESTDIKTPLVAVGIGIIVLVLLCIVFVVYNKKCKQGGDHDYDMNREDTLVGDHSGDDVELANKTGESEALTSNENTN